MRFFSWLITLPLAAIAVSFAVSNRGEMAVRLWPLEHELVAPVFLVVLVPAVIAFALGGLVTWLSGARYRRALRRTEHEAERLRRQRDDARQEAAGQHRDSLAVPPAAPESDRPRLLSN